MVSAKRVNASGCKGEECGNQCSFGERRSMIEEIIMGVIADTGEHSHQQSGRMEKERECNI
jgi:hypothetical protein